MTDLKITLTRSVAHRLPEQKKVVKEGLYKKVFIMAIQKETFDAVYDFLESEAIDEV